MPYADEERNRACRRAWYHKTKDKKRAKNTAAMKKWRKAHPDYFRAKAKEWRAAKPMQYRLNSVRKRAKDNGIEFSITMADVPVPTHCPWLGTPLDWTFDGKRNSDSIPSIDRIDSTKGYVRGNIEVISWRANTIKNNATLDELVLFGKRAAKLKRGKK